MIVEGKHINFVTVEIEDAQFILDLRLNENKNKFMSKTDNNLQKQINWLLAYKLREKSKLEYYFKITDKNNNNIGLVRLYDFIDNSFCWGSWMIQEGSPTYVAIESALLVYEFSFYNIGFNRSHFEVRKSNSSVIAFHKRFGANIVKEDDEYYYFNFKKEDYAFIRTKYSKYLP